MFSKGRCDSHAMREVTCRFVGLACEPCLRLVLDLYTSQCVLKSIVKILRQARTKLVSLGLLMLPHWEPGY